MPQLDISTYAPQIIWLVITFVVLFLVMWKVIVPRISDALEVRQRRIEDNLARAAELQKEAEAVLEAYDASLANARADAQKMIAEASAQAAGEADKRNVELGEALSKRIADAEAAIDKARREALGSLNEAAADVAAAATERLIGEAPDRDTVSAAVLAAAKGRA